MAFIVQPFVGKEKLWELLNEETESECLDYKRTLDPRKKKDLCELAKDIGAMQISGGYIVVGADDRGQLSGEVPDDLLPIFDESRLRAKLARYLPDNFEILAASHVLEGKNVILIYVAENPDGFAIFKSDGQYADGCAFKEGAVYARHGTSSTAWSQSDVTHIRANIIAREKEKWFAERREERKAELESEVRTTSAAEQARDAPAESLSWELDDQTFRTMVIEQLRKDDPIPLKLFLNRAPLEAGKFVDQEDFQAEMERLLSRLVCLAALLLELDESEKFEKVVEVLVSIYDLGFDDRGLDRSLAIGRERLWLMILERIVALGAYALRRENWAAVRYLATRLGHGESFHGQRSGRYFSWLRHGLTMAARANLFGEGTLLSLAQTVAQREECLGPDLSPNDERLLTSICQFDALAMVATIHEAQRLDVYYPSFSRYYEHRTQPGLARLLTDHEMRQIVFPGSDDDLATVFRYIDHTARQEGFRYAGWDSMHDQALNDFLRQHPASPEA